jgi:hypothetical protein
MAIVPKEPKPGDTAKLLLDPVLVEIAIEVLNEPEMFGHLIDGMNDAIKSPS